MSGTFEKLHEFNKDAARGEEIPTETAERQLPEPEDALDLLEADLEPPPELVCRILHQGSKAIIGGASKSHKTWLLLDLGLSVASGVSWLGFDTNRGKVLFINFEIQRAFFKERLQEVMSKKQIALDPGDFQVMSLRGLAADIAILEGKLMNKIKNKDYVLIIFDPLYKMLGVRDENASGDMADLMNVLERIATDSGAAVVFGSHFSKGNQAAKESMDRVSGSGVLGRDPDTILILTRHEEDDAFVIEPTLRNFPPIDDFCVRWSFPLMIRDNNLDPTRLKQPGNRKSKVGHGPNEEEFLSLFPKTWPEDNPGKALLSSAQMRALFSRRGWDKALVPDVRDEYEQKKKIRVLTGLPRNQILAGLPEAVAAFERDRKRP